MNQSIIAVLFAVSISGSVYAQWDEQMVIAHCSVERQLEWLVQSCEARADNQSAVNALKSAVSRWKEIHASTLPPLRNFCRRSPFFQASIDHFEQAKKVAEARMAGQAKEEIASSCHDGAKAVFHPQYHITSIVDVNPLPKP